MSKIISPIAIDMGAKNTGVYYAKYERGTTFKNIEKHGQVLVYGNDNTSLLKKRTSNRHVRRGYQRKKLAKRLLMIILKEYFGFPAEKHTQAIGFLMNRRGFSFLEEEYSKDYLNNFPKDAWQALSKEVQDILGEQKKIADKLMKLATDEPEKIIKLLEGIQNIEGYIKYQNLKKDAVYYKYIEKISSSCDARIENKEIEEGANDRNKLSKASKWIVERLVTENSIGSISINDKNLLEQMQVLTPEQAETLKKYLPNVREKQIKKSIWDFKHTDFDLDKKESDLSFNVNDCDIDKKEKKIQSYNNAHLHHFCYAIYKINNELISGGRHRSKFFEEIKADLETFSQTDFLQDRHSPKYLVNFIQQIHNTDALDIDKLYKLVCHISNFELKPLHKYFDNNTPIEHKKLNKEALEEYKNKKEVLKKENKKYTELDYLKAKYPENYHSHKQLDGGDKFSNTKLSRLASQWFMSHWMVTKEKDKQAKVESYKQLKTRWGKHTDKNNIVDFWLATDPKLTIPPYQAMLNRQPPKCQSLLLNGKYLNEHYPQWKGWLNLLSLNTDYKEKLKFLKGKSKIPLVEEEKIQLRQLQFILDIAKKQDKYKLNELWSIYHKLQKIDTDQTKWQEKLEKTINTSALPTELKQSLNFTQDKGFGHFLNKYYQTRRKARDGRYFLIQEKKEKWLTDNKLLTLCTHKPRQKKHQWQLDLAAVLGVNADDLKNKIDGDNPEDYFKSINGFASNCEKSAKAQKDHRGELKLKIYHELINKPPNGALAKLAKKCDELKQALIKGIGIDEILLDKQQNENNQKIALVFKFAQIHNIVFKDRSGFSKTCPVCSTDNAFRMQEDDKGAATASRLPALSIRLIDGVVMRICDAIARQVAVTKWNDIKEYLEEGSKVSIPLVLEQNHFEFEPNLQGIKGKKSDEIKDDRSDKYKGQKRSLYDGTILEKNGEIDHIIPRSSRYGMLNDEANLIYISKTDNQKKGNDFKFLRDLHKDYKQDIFGNKSDDEIKAFIYQHLGDASSKDFAFGKYLSFINLTTEQKKAFRHALFLQQDDPLREKVIQSLQNRNRAIVNGTQRYLAQCIADKIHRIVRKEGKENLIEFDYFEYSARWNDPKSTYNLRKEYGIDKLKEQPLYSHLVDAQLAFLIASEDHQNEGSMGIKFDENQTIWRNEVDKETGEVLPSQLFTWMDVGEGYLKEVNLNPKDSNQKIIDIEKHSNSNSNKQDLTKIFKRPIFKQNAIGERYKPIIKFENKWYLGYPMTVKGGIYNCDEYCQEITGNAIQRIVKITTDNKYYELTTENEQIKIWTIKVVDKKYKQIDKDSYKYFSQLSPEYDKGEQEEVDKIKFILKHCQYYVSKTEVINAPKVLNKQEAKKYPFYKNWLDLDNAWRGKIASDYSVKDDKYDISDDIVAKKWNEFCKEEFEPPQNQLKNQHQVKGKKYTMVSLGTASGTVFRINRGNQDIYQALPLDTNIIAKDKSNFLIKRSKNVTLVSNVADKDLERPINTEEKVVLNEFKVLSSKFFKNNFDDAEVYLNNTSVNIKNFPLDSFKQWFNRGLGGKTSIKLLTKSKAEQDKKDPELLYAIKEKVDNSIICKTRDGSISRIKIKGTLVNFLLPFKDTKKIYNDSKEE